MNGGSSGGRTWQMDSGRREGGKIWGATQVPVFVGVGNKLEGAGVWWNREASDAQISREDVQWAGPGGVPESRRESHGGDNSLEII